jgi:hypothetical protein
MMKKVVEHRMTITGIVVPDVRLRQKSRRLVTMVSTMGAQRRIRILLLEDYLRKYPRTSR